MNGRVVEHRADFAFLVALRQQGKVLLGAFKLTREAQQLEQERAEFDISRIVAQLRAGGLR